MFRLIFISLFLAADSSSGINSKASKMNGNIKELLQLSANKTFLLNSLLVILISILLSSKFSYAEIVYSKYIHDLFLILIISLIFLIIVSSFVLMKKLLNL